MMNEQKLMTLSVDEFLRRFLLHLLPKGFVRIRHFGFLAARRRATVLPLCFRLLSATPQSEREPHGLSRRDPVLALPKVWRSMKVVARLTAADLQLRSPPIAAAA